jgi:hypothetical protein
MINKIDLSKCVKGQKLRSKLGMILVYIRPLPAESYYDHEVMYPNGSLGTRMNDGFVYKNPDQRLPSDHDIVEILPL